MRRPERRVCSGRFRRVWTGRLRGRCQLRSRLHPCGKGQAGGISRQQGSGRERREGKRRAPGLTPPRSGEHHRLGRACDSQAPAGVCSSGIPGLLGRGQRPRPVPCPGSRRCPGSAGGRARARPGTAAPGLAGGAGRARGGRGRALPQARPAPPGPQRSRGPPQRRVYPGITCWRQLPVPPAPSRLSKPRARASLRRDPSPLPRVES